MNSFCETYIYMHKIDFKFQFLGIPIHKVKYTLYADLNKK